MNNLLIIISITLMYSTPLVFGAIGGVISEKSGVVNIGIEGMLTIGAAVGVIVGYHSQSAWLGFFMAGVAGGIFGLVHAFMAVTCRADQTVSGIALNLVGPGFALFLARLNFNALNTPAVPNKLPNINQLIKMPEKISSTLGSINITVFVAILVVVITWFIFEKTRWGLRLKAVGEHPAAADTVGVNIYLIRYVCVIISGVLAGFGGASMSMGIVSSFSPTTIAGQGFIALAAVIFGKWSPIGAYGACLIFGGAQALSIILGGEGSKVPSEVMAMIPYMLTIIILILFVGKSKAPKADGVPYVKGQR